MLIDQLYVKPSSSRVRPGCCRFAAGRQNLGQPVDFGFGALFGHRNEEAVGKVRVPLAEWDAGEVAGVGSLRQEVGRAAIAVANDEFLESGLWEGERQPLGTGQLLLRVIRLLQAELCRFAQTLWS